MIKTINHVYHTFRENCCHSRPCATSLRERRNNLQSTWCGPPVCRGGRPMLMRARQHAPAPPICRDLRVLYATRPGCRGMPDAAFFIFLLFYFFSIAGFSRLFFRRCCRERLSLDDASIRALRRSNDVTTATRRPRQPALTMNVLHFFSFADVRPRCVVLGRVRSARAGLPGCGRRSARPDGGYRHDVHLGDVRR